MDIAGALIRLSSVGALAGAIPVGWLAAQAARRLAVSTQPTLLVMILIEVAVALAAVALARASDLPTLLLAGWALGLLAVVDVLALRLPDVVTAPLALAGLLLGPRLSGSPLVDHLVGAVAGFVVLAGLAWVYARVRGREGLGLGDAKLLGVAGAWLGWQVLPNVVVLACAGGLLWVGIRVLRAGRGALAEPIAFGLPLCGALWALLLVESSGVL